MAKNVREIASEIDAFMKRKTLNFWTLPWQQFYSVVERERIREAFQMELKAAFKPYAIEINYGVNAIEIFREANFGPQDYTL